GNIFADICSLIAFTLIVFVCKREILIIKSFLDEIIYGLSDSAKAFLIILLTDMFVGYHSPHGWEVILKAIANHFGLAENRDFDFLFIATFPVILDTVLKYWIFRYLNRISPSSVATYKNMNE
ncbi:MAG: proton extrusion protein PcxA, partial [Xenococcus sp. (in: cyanobacteria)]